MAIPSESIIASLNALYFSQKLTQDSEMERRETNGTEADSQYVTQWLDQRTVLTQTRIEAHSGKQLERWNVSKPRFTGHHGYFPLNVRAMMGFFQLALYNCVKNDFLGGRGVFNGTG